MSRKIATVLIVTTFAVALLGTVPVNAGVHHPSEVYYNYYGPVAYDGTSAQLYVSPRPVPPHVGHTYIAYAPMMPHEYLYTHCKTYFRHDPCGGGMTVTRVHYGHRPQPFMRFYPRGRMFTDLLNLGHH